MQRLALPLQNGSLCQHFGKAPQVLIVNIENGTVVSEEILTAPEHAHGSMPNFLKANSVTDVLCGGIGDGALQMLREMNIVYNRDFSRVDILRDFLKVYHETAKIYS